MQKTGIPTEIQQLVVRGKVLTDNASLKDHGLPGGETIEMTAKLLGGMKHKSLSPKPMDTEKEKRKESEPCIDVGSLGDENAETNPDEEPTDTTKWMDDVSELERSMSGMQWNMTEVERKLDRVISSLVKITEGNEARDKKFDDLLASFSVGLAERVERFAPNHPHTDLDSLLRW